MSVLRRTRGAQYPLVAEFLFNYNDGIAALSSLTATTTEYTPRATVTDFGSGVVPAGLLNGSPYVVNPGTNSTFFEVLALPPGAQIISGDMQIETAYACTGTATLSLGDVSTGALYLAATSLKGTAWTNAPTGATNVVPNTVVYTNATANGITAIGQTITITGMSPAAYNGTFIVDAFTATSVTVTNYALTSTLTYVSGGAGTFITGRTALTIPDEITGSNATDASVGADLRATLAFGGTPAATAGRVRLRIMYTVDGRANEVQPQ